VPNPWCSSIADMAVKDVMKDTVFELASPKSRITLLASFIGLVDRAVN